MKRLTTAFLAVFLLSAFAFSGGIVTNTNQSAAWARYFARYATTDIDAVYFNPAGLSKLNEGFHFSINNQSIWQTQTFTNDFPYLRYGPEYVGDVKAPLFPSVYAAFQTGKFTISLGFNPIGGGGGATFDNGLPSFELMSGVTLVGTLNAAGIETTQYSMSSFLEGTSVYYGIQAGLTYEINDFISIAAGVRYVMANNTYSGYLKDLMIDPKDPLVNPNGDMVPAPLYFSELSDTTKSLADNVFYPAEEFAHGQTPTDPVHPFLALVLGQLGIDPTGMTNADAEAVFGGLGDQATHASMVAQGTALVTSDQEVDLKQTGSGITPMISVHISPSENIDIALKYEFITKLQLTNQTTKDFLVGFDSTGAPITMFPDGAVTNADMPALLSVGINVRPLDGLQLSAGFEYYWNKNVNWDGREELIDNNSYNVNFSAQYDFGRFLISGSYGYANMGVNQAYQGDLSYSLNSSSIGFGGAFDITEKIRINAGYAMVFYQDQEVPTGDPVMFTQTYGKDTKILAVGIDFSF